MESAIALVARQPIYDRRLQVLGYEVLYRSTDTQSAQFADPDQATAAVSISALLDLGLDALVRSSHAWINVSRGILVERRFEFLPPERVVIEVLESVHADRQVLDALAHARSLGYRIALDDFVPDERNAALIPFANYIKLDVLGLEPDELKRRVKAVARPGLQLLAEKVESHAVFDASVAAGFTLFQGYFFARPMLLEARSMPTDRLMLLRTIARLNEPNATIADIERLVASNVGLSIKLLRYVNSAALGTVRRIDSIHHAIMMLGLARVRACVMMLILANIEGKPQELVLTALIRARFCHLLAEALGEEPQPYFTTGLLSVIDAFMDQPMAAVVPQLSVSRELESALIERAGPFGQALNAVLACERADWAALAATGYDTESIKSAYLGALAWASETNGSIAA